LSSVYENHFDVLSKNKTIFIEHSSRNFVVNEVKSFSGKSGQWLLIIFKDIDEGGTGWGAKVEVKRKDENG
jgi:hypothetical protein